MKRACKKVNTNTYEQNASSIRPLKINFVRMKHLKHFSFLLLAGFLSLASCKKDNDTAIPDYFEPLIGKWEVQSGMDNVKYLIFTADNHCIKLKQYLFEIKSKETWIFQATKGQIVINENYYNSLYNTRVSNDTLYLTNQDKEIIAVKNQDAPAPEDWTGSISVQKSYPTPVDVLTDIGFDGNSLWYGNGYSSHYLYKMNLANGALDSIPTTKYAWSVEFANPYLWVSSNGGSIIYSVDKNNGNDIANSTTLGPWIYGIAWDGQYFWCYSGNDRTLRKYDPVGDAVVSQVELGSTISAHGLAYTNGYLYIVVDGGLAKCSVAPFKAVNTYELKGYSLYGVAFDGTSFWVSASDLKTNEKKILKVDF
jgi:hypothetical protein